MNEGRKGFLRVKWQSLWEHILAAIAAKYFLEAMVIVLGGVSFVAWFWLLIRENWQIAVGSVVVFIPYIILWRRNARTTSAQIAELLPYKSLAESCGFEGYRSLKTPLEKKAGWGDWVARTNAYDELSLAVFTGASTFAYDDSKEEGEKKHFSPLREALERHQGHLKILLMQTDCPAWEQCITAFGNGDAGEEQTYRTALEVGYQKAFDFCHHLARKRPDQLKSIEVRTYDRPPLWKMAIMGNFIWLQHYFPGEHVDDRPAYIVRRGVAGGMAHSLKSVFDYRWETGKTVIHRDENGNYGLYIPPTPRRPASATARTPMSHAPDPAVPPPPPLAT